MDDSRQFLRLKKLTGKNIVRVAAKHNLREIQAEIGADGHIDAMRSCKNRTIAGPESADLIEQLAERLMLEGKVPKLRKDAVRGIEIVFSLPPVSAIDNAAFFADSLEWSRRYFKAPVLSAVIHNDEAAPHCHVLLLPLIDGRMVGSDLMGGRKRLQDIQISFFEQVGGRYGLVRPKAQARLSAMQRAKSASLILSAIQSNHELIDRVDIEHALLDTLSRHPEPMLTALKLTVPSQIKPKRSFVEIMTKPVKPEKAIGLKRYSKPIGFVPDLAEKEQTLSCVGFGAENMPVNDSESASTNGNPATNSTGHAFAADSLMPPRQTRKQRSRKRGNCMATGATGSSMNTRAHQSGSFSLERISHQAQGPPVPAPISDKNHFNY